MATRVLPLLLLAACPQGAPPEGAADADAPSQCGSWSSVGEPFVLTWCAGCHSAELPEGRRYGAPVGMDLDTLEAVTERSASVRAALEGGRMPPAGGVPAAEHDAFLAWLACGAPGEAHRLVPGSPGVSALGGDLLFGGYTEEQDGAFRASFEGGTLGELALSFVGLEDGAVGLEGWALTDAEGSPRASALVDPPLWVWPPEDALQTVLRTVSWDGEQEVDEGTWAITFEREDDPDPRFADPDVLRTRLDDGAGATIELWTSSLHGLQALDIAYGPLSGGRKDRLLALSASAPFDRGDAYPQQPGDIYLVRRTVLVEGLE